MSQVLQLKDAPLALQNFVHAYTKADLLPFAMIYVDKNPKGNWEVTVLPWGPMHREYSEDMKNSLPPALPLAVFAGLFDNSYKFKDYRWTSTPLLQNWMKHCRFLERKSSRYFPYAPVETEVDGVKPLDFQIAVHAACYSLQYDLAVAYIYSSDALLAPDEAKSYAFCSCKDPLLSIWDNYRYLLKDCKTTDEIKEKLANTSNAELAELRLPLPIIFQ